MKVALFFDGKNFYSGWRDRSGRQPLDFVALSRWLVRRVGGSVLWGAYYYTGIEVGQATAASGQVALTGFLDNLELLPGYFVQRFNRRVKSCRCRQCDADHLYTQENEVDTTMVADMLRLAAVGAFDILVLMSGDGDHAPAVEGVRALGRQAYVATWGSIGLSRRIRRAAFDHIDLGEALAECSRPPVPSDGTGEGAVDGSGGAEHSQQILVPRPGAVAPSSQSPPRILNAGGDETSAAVHPDDHSANILLDELRRAERKFPLGYVGVNFFVTRWQSADLDPDPDFRRRLIDRLAREERIEIYTVEDGTKALRLKRPAASQPPGSLGPAV